MLERFWTALAAIWRRQWHNASGRIASRGLVEDERSRRLTSRARFWAELREGEREAEARAALRRP